MTYFNLLPITVTVVALGIGGKFVLCRDGIIQNSTFEEDELNRERGVIIQEIGMYLDTPDDMIFDYWQDKAYPNQPMGRSILGKTDIIKNIIFFSITSGLLILSRGEFLIIFAFTLFFIFIKKKMEIINLIKILMIVFLVISPYVIRNYIHFNQFIIVKSLGYKIGRAHV